MIKQKILDVLEETSPLSGPAIRSATGVLGNSLYVTLQRMEDEGLITIDRSGGKRLFIYALVEKD